METVAWLDSPSSRWIAAADLAAGFGGVRTAGLFPTVYPPPNVAPFPCLGMS